MSLKTTERGRGKQGYRAPELLRGLKSRYSQKLDVWSLGCILFEVCTGTKAFATDFAVLEYLFSKAKRDVPLPNWIPEASKQHLTLWIHAMLNQDYENRPSSDQMCKELLNFAVYIRDRDQLPDYESGARDTTPSLKVDGNVLMGTDVPTRDNVLRWDDLFAPGNFSQHKRSLQRYKRLMDDRKALLGNEHMYTVWSKICFAQSLMVLEAGDQAISHAIFNEVLAVNMRCLGATHCETLSAQTMLAWSYYRDGNKEGLRLMQQTLRTQQKALGLEYHLTLGSMRRLGRMFFSLGEKSSSEWLHSDALESQRNVLGRDHPETLATMSSLASIYSATGRPEDAAKMLEEVVQAQTRVLGLEHFETLSSMVRRASAYYALGQISKAVQFFEEVLEVLMLMLGIVHSETRDCADMLIRGYNKMDEIRKAVKLKADLL